MTTRRSLWPGLILFAILLILLSGRPAEAEEQFALASNGTLLTIPRGESLLLPVFKPKRVAVAEPAIADVVMVNTGEVLINGIGVGTTSLQIWEGSGVSHYRVRVVPNPDALASELSKQLNLPGIKVHFINDNVILDGIVQEPEEKERALKLAGAYGEVIDLLQIAGTEAEPDLSERVAVVIDRPHVSIRAINDYIVMEGEVPSLEERQRAEALAATFSKPVLNFLQVPAPKTSMEDLAIEIVDHINIPSVSVHVIAGSTFLLEGTVQKEAAKERAAAIAYAFGKPVVNLISVEDTSQHDGTAMVEESELLEYEDESFSAKVEATILEEPSFHGPLAIAETQASTDTKDIMTWAKAMEREIADSAVSLRVIQDAVLLEGTVESEIARQRATAIAELYPVRIVSLLQVQGEPTFDSARERELLETYIKAPNIQVTLVGHTVLLEGIAASEMARRRAVAIARALDLEVVDLLEVEESLLPPEGTPLAGSDAVESDAETGVQRLRQLVPDMTAAVGEETLKIFELNGFIVIEGQLPNEYRRLRAERIASTFQVPLLTLIEVEPLKAKEEKELRPLSSGSETVSRREVEVEQESLSSDEEIIDSIPMPSKAEGEKEHLGLSLTEESLAQIDDTPQLSLAQEIAEAINIPQVKVQIIKGAAILDGCVMSELEAQGAVAIAGLFTDTVVNRLEIASDTGHPEPSLSKVVSELLDLPTVKVSQVGEKLVLEGFVTDQADVERAAKLAGAFGKEVIDLIKVEAPLQVLLKVKVVEASRVDLDKLGMTWGSLERGVLLPDTAFFGEIIIGEPMERLLPLGAKLEALVDEGKARLLAAPSLLTLSGKEAEFLGGGEIPVVVPKDGEMQIVWKAYGVGLKILPVVVDDDAIEVHVSSEVSSLDWANAIRIESLTLPAMKTRRAETRVWVKDGTTFVIGGLLENSEAEQMHKVPILGDLPIIGKLFRSEQFNKGQTELVFFVTPHVLRGNEPADNHDLWRDGFIEGTEGREGTYHGPAITSAHSR